MKDSWGLVSWQRIEGKNFDTSQHKVRKIIRSQGCCQTKLSQYKKKNFLSFSFLRALKTKANIKCNAMQCNAMLSNWEFHIQTIGNRHYSAHLLKCIYGSRITKALNPYRIFAQTQLILVNARLVWFYRSHMERKVTMIW